MCVCVCVSKNHGDDIRSDQGKLSVFEETSRNGIENWIKPAIIVLFVILNFRLAVKRFSFTLIFCLRINLFDFVHLRKAEAKRNHFIIFFFSFCIFHSILILFSRFYSSWISLRRFLFFLYYFFFTFNTDKHTRKSFAQSIRFIMRKWAKYVIHSSWGPPVSRIWISFSHQLNNFPDHPILFEWAQFFIVHTGT